MLPEAEIPIAASGIRRAGPLDTPSALLHARLGGTRTARGRRVAAAPICCGSGDEAPDRGVGAAADGRKQHSTAPTD